MPHSLLPAEWDVPDVFRRRLGDEPGRQRAMAHEGQLLLVLHRVPQANSTVRAARLLWRDADGTWHSTDGQSGPGVLRAHLTEYDKVVSALDEAEHDAATSAEYLSLLSQVTPLVRAARNLHATLQTARELCPADRDLINSRDHAYRLERTTELLASDARASLDVATLRRAEQQAANNAAMARSAHRMNLLAAIFLPLATLCTIFGVDMSHPLRQTASLLPFYLIVGLGMTLGLAIAVFVSTRR